MAINRNDEKLLDLLEQARLSDDPAHDIETLAGPLTADDGYRLQLAFRKRLAARGDAHIGYRISMTSRNGMAEAAALGLVSKETAAGAPTPVFTSLSASNLAGADNIIRLREDRIAYAEGEVTLMLGRPLAGPGVTAATARAAVDAVYASLDMAQIRLEKKFGWAHTLASTCAPEDTTIVLGNDPASPLLDLRTEGILTSIDGEYRSSATAWETLGGPYEALAWLANRLAIYGEALKPGHIIVTGVCAYPQRIGPLDRTARVDFTRIGSATARIIRNTAQQDGMR